MTTKKAKQTFRVWTEKGKETNSEYLKPGDLVQINLKDKWTCENPIPGFFMGMGFSTTLGDLVLIKIPIAITHDNANGIMCEAGLKEYQIDEITHVQFLARGSAAYILFHNFVGGLFLKNKILREKINQIKKIVD